jgi:glycerate kinase
VDVVRRLDEGLAHLAACIEEQLGLDVADLPGAGAAGGMGAGAMAFLGGELVRGIDAILDLTDADGRYRDADLVITGEGCVDAQSLQGKVVQGVAARARSHGAKIAVIAGEVRLDEADWRQAGIETAISLISLSGSAVDAMQRPAHWLREAGRTLARTL